MKIQVDIQQVLDQLASRISQLEIDKAISNVQLNQLQKENEELKKPKEEASA